MAKEVPTEHPMGIGSRCVVCVGDNYGHMTHWIKSKRIGSKKKKEIGLDQIGRGRRSTREKEERNRSDGENRVDPDIVQIRFV